LSSLKKNERDIAVIVGNDGSMHNVLLKWMMMDGNCCKLGMLSSIFIYLMMM
jgi:hypothetical protein